MAGGTLTFDDRMNKALIKKVEDVFCSALEIQSSEKRKIFLDDACQGDAELRARVEELLALKPEAEKFFQGLRIDLS